MISLSFFDILIESKFVGHFGVKSAWVIQLVALACMQTPLKKKFKANISHFLEILATQTCVYKVFMVKSYL